MITFFFAFKIPLGCSSLHHEIELGIVIGEKGTDITEKNAMNHVAGYVLALDMTARDFQVAFYSIVDATCDATLSTNAAMPDLD